MPSSRCVEYLHTIFYDIRKSDCHVMTKQLSKEIMKRSRLHSNFLRNKTEENKILYNRQMNYCVSILQKFFKKMLWKLTYKELITNYFENHWNLYIDKSRIRNRISISEKGGILKTESETAETLKNFFSSIVKDAHISRYIEFNSVKENIKHCRSNS